SSAVSRICMGFLPALENSTAAGSTTITGCRHTRQPITLSMIAIHSLVTENDLADEFVAAFHARRFAEKFFYWFPLSVRAWLALCSDGAYVTTSAPAPSSPSPPTGWPTSSRPAPSRS